MRNKKGFTLIELLVVIAIIGLLSTLAVVALNSARSKSRDSKRVADIKQVQTALELYFADQNGYPPGNDIELGSTDYKALCSNGFQTSGACEGTTYMGLVPMAPDPHDGDCTADNNDYQYTQSAATTYQILFCLGGKVGDLTAGARTADATGIR